MTPAPEGRPGGPDARMTGNVIDGTVAIVVESIAALDRGHDLVEAAGVRSRCAKPHAGATGARQTLDHPDHSFTGCPHQPEQEH